MKTKKAFFVVLFLSTIILLHSPAMAADGEYEIVIKEHRFLPAVLTIPVDRKIRLIVNNQDATAEEFESFPLNREKVVTGNSRITIFLGPLRPGTYKFFGDFHQDTAQGVITVQ